MEISITINTDNSAFEDDAALELHNFLLVLRDKVGWGDVEVEPGACYPLRDSNGNRVGFFSVKS